MCCAKNGFPCFGQLALHYGRDINSRFLHVLRIRGSCFADEIILTLAGLDLSEYTVSEIFKLYLCIPEYCRKFIEQ